MSKKYIHKIPQRVQDGIDKTIKKNNLAHFRKGIKRGKSEGKALTLFFVSTRSFVERLKYLFTKKLT